MRIRVHKRRRLLSIIGFAFTFSYLIVFLIEGRLLYSLLEGETLPVFPLLIAAMGAHGVGLFLSGFIIDTVQKAKKALFWGMSIALAASFLLLLSSPAAALAAMLLCGFCSAFALASWAFYLLRFTPRQERFRTCAEALAGANFLMILINMLLERVSGAVGLAVVGSCVCIGLFVLMQLPLEEKEMIAAQNALSGNPIKPADGAEPVPEMALGRQSEASLPRKPLSLLFLFIAVITINSGLMYEFINPSFQHLQKLADWFWASPYMLALLILSRIWKKHLRPFILYLAMGMMVAAFLAFMLLGRDLVDYLIVDSLLLGAFGIFDLFWWTILAEMLDFVSRPVRLFGIGLSANVMGILCGSLIAHALRVYRVADAKMTVISLLVVCVILVLIPALSRQLSLVLEAREYLADQGIRHAARSMENTNRSLTGFENLTKREQQVLLELLSGKSNREIAKQLYISENTVKTHMRNILAKYDVKSRTDLLSYLIKAFRQ